MCVSRCGQAAVPAAGSSTWQAGENGGSRTLESLRFAAICVASRREISPPSVIQSSSVHRRPHHPTLLATKLWNDLAGADRSQPPLWPASAHSYTKTTHHEYIFALPQSAGLCPQ